MIKADKSIAGNMLTLQGQTFERGMGVHANSLLVYTIPEGMTRFVAYVGIDDEVRERAIASVVFKVYGDVKEMGEDPALIAKSPLLCTRTLLQWVFDVELSDRFRELRLVVEDGGDGNADDYANWVNAGFLK
jgi:hypothetical protein